MNSSDAYSSRSEVLDMKMAAALGRLKAEAMPKGDLGSAPLSVAHNNLVTETIAKSIWWRFTGFEELEFLVATQGKVDGGALDGLAE